MRTLEIHERRNPMKTKFEGIIRYIAICLVNRNKKSAKHHLNRILPYYDQMTPAEQDVVTALRLRIYC
jgi:hypothetical protein